jgi:hypothetical protein
MSHYEIYVTCTECRGEHPMRVRINLDDGPLDKQSISDAYSGKTRPPQLQAIEGRKVLCLKTGRTFIQSKVDNMFLVPTDMMNKKAFSSV